MKIKEEYEIESGTRKRWYNYYSCDNCSTEYRKQKRLAEGAPQEHLCSRKCYYDYVNPNNVRTTLQCAHCKISFTRATSKTYGSKSGLYFCSREHKDLAQSYLEAIQPLHYGTGNGTYGYRDKALKLLKHECVCCGYSNVNALEVHHKDRDRTNNEISNLEFLCSNCHTLEHKGLRTGVQR